MRRHLISALDFLRSYSGGIPYLSQAMSERGEVMTGPRFLPGLKVSMVISFLDMKVYILLRSYKFNLCLNLNIFDLNLRVKK